MAKVWELMTPETWAQGHQARNCDGAPVRWDALDACRWCGLAWIWKVYGGPYNPASTVAAGQVEALIINWPSLSFWQDQVGRTFEDVRDLMRRAGV